MGQTASIVKLQFATIVAPPAQAALEQIQVTVSADRQHVCPAPGVGHWAMLAPVKESGRESLVPHWQNARPESLLQEKLVQAHRASAWQQFP